MILTPHAIIGAAVASALPGHPVVGFALALASHYLADMIPHNHYAHHHFIIKETRSIASLVHNIKAVYQLSLIFFDFALGTLLAVLFFARDWYSLLIVLIGVAGGVLPDFLRFVHYKYKHDFFSKLTKFHDSCECKNNLDHKPALGATIQFITTSGVVILLALIK